MIPPLRRFSAACALLLACVGCGRSRADAGGVRVGAPLPAYAALTLDGDSVPLRAFRGRPLVLNVWATWCPPCREEMPGLQRLHEAYADSGLQVVGVSIDRAPADGMVREFLDELKIGFTILRDPESAITRTFQMNGVPETFVVDARGRLVQRWIGQIDPDGEEFRSGIHAVLSKRRS